MQLSYKWLKQYVNLPDSTTPVEISEKLKMSTVEVEGIVYQGAGLERVVVGEILEFRKHANAEKLHVAKVDVGEDKPRQVIFGQMVKMEPGFKVPVALAPTTLPGNKKIDKGEIRGEMSEGMLCLDQELGLLSNGVSIRFFDKKVKNGTPVADALELNDAILEIDNKSLSNRPDLWGHYGMAREVAVLTNREVGKYEVKPITEGKEVKIKIDNADVKLCPRYMAVAIDGITVGPSPAWMQQRLIAAGLRPINNIVDITNYVMLDVGQPMHAFDMSELTGASDTKKIKVTLRKAKDNEPFTTLDGVERVLDPSMLVIEGQDGKPALIPGVMGGLGSGIKDATTKIVFESANFEASLIRRTSSKLGLRTDSSARFEKSLDPNWCAIAMAKAVALTLEVCPGAKVVSNVADEKHFRLQTGPLEIPLTFFAQKIGIEIPVKNIITILERLGFEVTEKKKTLLVKIPTWRATKDISIAEDIVEEVVRIVGYDNVPSSLPAFTITPPEKNFLRALEWQVADALVRDLNYTEVYNYSFVSAQQITAMGDSVEGYLELNNPLSKEKPYLRRYLLLNLFENVQNNIAGRACLQMFEIGKVYRSELPGLRAQANGDELLPKQDTYLTSVYVEKKNNSPFWEARRVVEMLGERLGLSLEIVPASNERADRHPGSGRHPSRWADVLCAGIFVGSVYEVHPMVSLRFGIEERIGVAQLNLNKLAEVQGDASKNGGYVTMSPYPEVVRDLAFIVKNDTSHKDLYEAIRAVDPMVKFVELFDVYQGKGVGEGYKSMAYHITYAHPEKTLTTVEVDTVGAKVMTVLKDKFKAEVRG